MFNYIYQGKARSDMTVEERIEAANRRKEDGNAYFKDEKLEKAMQQYEMVISNLLWNPLSCSQLRILYLFNIS